MDSLASDQDVLPECLYKKEEMLVIAPHQIMVGKPGPRPKTAPAPERSKPPPPSAASASTTPRGTVATAPVVPRVPLNRVTAAKAMQRSASVDYVRVNKRNAALTPRRVQATPPPSEWKMSRWGRVTIGGGITDSSFGSAAGLVVAVVTAGVAQQEQQ